MTLERRIKVFGNGRNRAVRIPREFEFPGDEAIMRNLLGSKTCRRRDG